MGLFLDTIFWLLAGIFQIKVVNNAINIFTHMLYTQVIQELRIISAVGIVLSLNPLATESTCSLYSTESKTEGVAMAQPFIDPRPTAKSE